MSNYNAELQGNNADLQGILDSIKALPDGSGGGIALLAEYSQVNPIVAQYMAQVQYPAGDYSESLVVPYLYEETTYDKGYPVGYDVTIQQAGVLHMVDSVATVHAPSVVGANTLYNAIPGEVAHWWHTVADNVTQTGTIRPTGQVRMIQTTANNVRDLGGWPCDGGTIKYGKLFRGGLLDASDRAVLVEQLKIRHDLDLRGAADNGGLAASPLGADVSYVCPDEYVWYSLAKEAAWRAILRKIFEAVSKNEPLIFHCAAGADRTGTVACIVEAILGVGQPDLDKDFELTSFSIFPNARRRIDDDWKGLMAEIDAISVGATFRDKVINWVGYLGFTAEQINAFRRAMIDGNPGDITVEEYAPQEPVTNYFDASTAMLNYRLGSNGSPSAYNGMVTTDFIPWNDEMIGKNFYVTGVTMVLSTAYNYFTRVVYYDADKTKVADFTDGGAGYDDYITPTFGAYTGGGFMRISLVLKDNVEITAADVADLKITLK